MPVISMVSTKGGTGKSTTANVLACELASTGADVAIIDADPNQPQIAWAGLEHKPENITVISETDKDKMYKTIEAAETKYTFVIIDCEGTANPLVSDAVSRADLVLVPLQASHLDATQAAKSAAFIKQVEGRFKVTIPYAFIFTRMNAAIKTRDYKDISEQIEGQGLPVLPVQMIERAAFRGIFSFGGSVHTMDSKAVASLDKARDNAKALAAAVLDRLREKEEAA